MNYFAMYFTISNGFLLLISINLFVVIQTTLSECPPYEILISHICFPLRLPGENCIHSAQCLNYQNETQYSCIDNICQPRCQTNNAPHIDFSQIYSPEHIESAENTTSEIRLAPRKKNIHVPLSWTSEHSFMVTSQSSLVCPDQISRPLIRNGAIVDCMKQKCGKNYACEYIPMGRSGRYVCCEKTSTKMSSRPSSILGLPGLRGAQNYGLGFSPTSLYSGLPANLQTESGCTTKTCAMCTGDCGCMQRVQNEYLCCPKPLTQNSLNFGFLQWTIAINLNPIAPNCLPHDFGYCYCPSVKIVASIIPIIPIIPTTVPTTTTMIDPDVCGTCRISSLRLIAGKEIGETPTVKGGCQRTSVSKRTRHGRIRSKRQASRPSITVTCDASSVPNAVVYMEFNDGTLGGPISGQNARGVVSATCTCMNGKWYYTANGTSTQITSVSCVSAVKTPCASCLISDLTLTQGTHIGEMPMIPDGLMTEADGCVSVNVVCDASSVPGAIVLMDFNNGDIGGPTVNQIPTAVAKLTCGNDDKWYYMEGTTARQVFEIRCSSTACGTCAMNGITLQPPDPSAGELMPSISNGCSPGTTAGSSASMTILCQNPIPTEDVAISFYDSTGIDYLLQQETGTATMTINCVNGDWEYEAFSVVSVVCLDVSPQTLAAVFESKPKKFEKILPNEPFMVERSVGITEPFAGEPENTISEEKIEEKMEITEKLSRKPISCSVNQLLMHPGTGQKELPAIRPRKDQTLDVVCMSDTPNGLVFMEFNKNSERPFIPSPNLQERVKAKLKCLDGNWHYIKNSTDEFVEQVSCLQKRTVKLRRNPIKNSTFYDNSLEIASTSDQNSTPAPFIIFHKIRQSNNNEIRRFPRLGIESKLPETNQTDPMLNHRPPNIIIKGQVPSFSLLPINFSGLLTHQEVKNSTRNPVNLLEISTRAKKLWTSTHRPLRHTLNTRYPTLVHKKKLRVTIRPHESTTRVKNIEEIAIKVTDKVPDFTRIFKRTTESPKNGMVGLEKEGKPLTGIWRVFDKILKTLLDLI